MGKVNEIRPHFIFPSVTDNPTILWVCNQLCQVTCIEGNSTHYPDFLASWWESLLYGPITKHK